jgi:hypothetical protein
MTADDATDIPASVWPEFSRVMVIDAITFVADKLKFLYIMGGSTIPAWIP